MSRRETLRQAALQFAGVWAALAQAPSAGLKFFTMQQAREVEAIAEQILPADELGPGAREAGVVNFIDLALLSFERDKQDAYLVGLKSPGPFASLDATGQIERLRSIEKTDFFETLRYHTIAGFFSHPRYGDNRNRAGWKLLGFEDRHVFEPPFGCYDGPEGAR